MKLIIEIPDKDYEFIKDLKTIVVSRGNCKTIQCNVINSIKNSIPYKERDAKVNDIVLHWNDENSGFISALIAFEKILDIYKGGN